MSANDLKYKNIFEEMEQAVYITDPNNYNILYLNKTLQDLFPGDNIGKKCYKIFQGFDEPCPFCTNDKLFGKNPISPYIWDFYNKKIDRWFHITDQVIFWKGRKVRFEMAEDITEKKKLQEKVKESQQQLNSILSSIKDTVFVISPNHEILYNNETAHDLFGEELVGRYCYNIIKGNKKSCEKCPMEHIFGGESCQVRVGKSIKTPKSKDPKYFDVMFTPIKDYDGKFAIIEVLRDNTENRKLSADLQKSIGNYQHLSQELEDILDAIPGLVFYKDKNNRFIQVNKYIADAHHITKEQLIGKSLFELYPRKEAQKYWEDDLRVIESGKARLNIEERWQTEEGTKWINTSKIPYLDEEGNVKGIIGVSMDITDKKKYELELKKHRDHLDYLVKERIKELNCLYSTMELIEIHHFDIDTLLSEIVKILPEALQFPSIACAMIKCENHTYETKNFQKTQWCLTNDIKIKNYVVGKIYVCYLELLDEHKYEYHDDPFLEEEKNLLRSIAHQISRALTRRKSQLTIEKTQKKFRNTFEQAAVGIAHISPKGKILDLNQRFCDIIGYTKEEMLSKSLEDITHKEDLEEDTHSVSLMLNGEINTYSMEKRYIHKRGSIVWVNLTISLVKNTDGQPEYFITVIEDITKKKKMEEQIKKNEILYRTIAENLPNGILHIIDSEFNYIYNAGKELETLGLTNEMLVGKNIKDILDPKAAQFVASKYRECLKMNEIVSFEGDFGGRSFMVNAIPLADKLNKIHQLLVLSVDITERKKLEKKLQLLVNDLQRSNKELEQFAYVASHDLQEPLRMVASFTQLLQKRYSDKLDTDANEFIEFAVDGARRMQALINDLLILSRVGTRGKPFRKTDMNIILNHVKSNLYNLIKKSKTNINSGPLPVIIADENQMIQLLQNLISNAIKFKRDEPPQIYLHGETLDDKWVFSVKDNGIGIDPKYFEKIFIIFQRLHKKDDYGGTGIGLALCKKIVQRHHGKIWVESKKDEGSIFYFSIPKNEKNINK
ncbi:MAG: putative Sensory transduction histidine kinase [Promethearchaeota archaeon]|nr:MAG: putative Sensory transduction histidine kinase [Candidatus Lokiarchaeota archaeon]